MRKSRTATLKDEREGSGLAAGLVARAASWIVAHPREFVGALLGLTAALTILVNALFLQPGPHPAPMFKTQALAPAEAAPVLPRPRPEQDVVPRTRGEIITDIQRELARRGFYDGTVDGIYGSKTDAAMRDFEQHSGLKLGAEPAEIVLRTILQAPAPQAKSKPKTTSIAPAAVAPAAPATSAPAAAPTTNAKRSDPLGELIAPSPKRVLAVQRALADFGYGQIKPTGVFGPDTERAIEKFERDRKLPVTGHISDRLLRELAGMTGRPLE